MYILAYSCLISTSRAESSILYILVYSCLLSTSRAESGATALLLSLEWTDRPAMVIPAVQGATVLSSPRAPMHARLRSSSADPSALIEDREEREGIDSGDGSCDAASPTCRPRPRRQLSRSNHASKQCSTSTIASTLWTRGWCRTARRRLLLPRRHPRLAGRTTTTTGDPSPRGR